MSGSSRKAGDYPGIITGSLRASIRTDVSGDRLTVSTNMPYSGYLRYGTKKMPARKMSPDALKEGLEKAGRLHKWAEWVRG